MIRYGEDVTEEEVILSIRVPKSLRQQFQAAMKQDGTNASEYLRAAMLKRLEYMTPELSALDPVNIARQILDGVPVWSYIQNGYLMSGYSHTEAYHKNLVVLFNMLSYTVVEQDALLEKFSIFGAKLAEDRESIKQRSFNSESVSNNIDSYNIPQEPHFSEPTYPYAFEEKNSY